MALCTLDPLPVVYVNEAMGLQNASLNSLGNDRVDEVGLPWIVTNLCGYVTRMSTDDGPNTYSHTGLISIMYAGPSSTYCLRRMTQAQEWGTLPDWLLCMSLLEYT